MAPNNSYLIRMFQQFVLFIQAGAGQEDEDTYVFVSSGVSGPGNAGVLEDVLICRLVRLLEALPICARISSRELASMVSAFANLPSSSSCMAWMLFCTACR